MFLNYVYIPVDESISSHIFYNLLTLLKPHSTIIKVIICFYAYFENVVLFNNLEERYLEYALIN